MINRTAPEIWRANQTLSKENYTTTVARVVKEVWLEMICLTRQMIAGFLRKKFKLFSLIHSFYLKGKY